MLTKSQRDTQAASFEMLRAACEGITSDAMLRAVEAVIEARPDILPANLEAFAQRMSRRADDLERQSRK